MEELLQLLGLTGDRTKTKTPGTKATGSGARDALEPLNTSRAAVYRQLNLAVLTDCAANVGEMASGTGSCAGGAVYAEEGRCN